jgi:hypothetical protein
MIWRLLAANVLLLTGGLGVLLLIGAARTPRELAARSGLGWLLGLATGGVVLAALALLGVGSSWLVLGLFAGIGLAAGAARLRRGEGPRLWPGALALIAAGLLVALLVHAGLAFSVAPLVKWDSWALWAVKAKLIDDLGGAPAAIFGNQREVYLPHLDYPLLMPALESADFRAMGSQDVQLLHLQFLLFVPASLAAIAGVLFDVVPTTLLCAALLAIGAAPAVLGELLTAYVDLPLALLFCVGAAAAGRWLVTGERWPLAVAAILFGAATWTKNEGTLFVAAALVALALAAGRRRLRPVLMLAAATVTIALPWRVYTAVHGVHSDDYHYGDSFDWSYVTGRLGRGPIAVRALAHSLFDPSQWALLAPLFLLACAAALVTRRERLALFALALVLLGLAGLTWTYVISPLGLPDYLSVTTDRVPASLVLAAVALSPLLAADAWNALTGQPWHDQTSRGQPPPSRRARRTGRHRVRPRSSFTS